jgi:hypothetical protein
LRTALRQHNRCSTSLPASSPCALWC